MSSRARRPPTRTAAASATAAVLLSSSAPWTPCHGFAPACHRRSRGAPRHVFAPPGSGYVSHTDTTEEEEAGDARPSASAPALTAAELRRVTPRAFPTTYEPMLEYPGTMRPGRTPENMPYHDLPNLGIDDPDPVPWPHFQEIEWHHRWDPPHPQAMTMEDFIEAEGRWASVEDEAEMRMGMRRGVRERREMEELESGGGGAGSGPMVIMDDEDEEEGEAGQAGATASLGLGLGEGVEALLRTVADSATAGGAEEEAPEEEEGDDDDFLLDLGLGGEEAEGAEAGAEQAVDTTATAAADDDEDDDLDLAFELGLDLDDDDDGDDENGDDEEDGAFEVQDSSNDADISLDAYNKEDDEGDDDELDDGGFDYGE